MLNSAYERHFKECPSIIKKFLNYKGTIQENNSLSVKTYYYDLKRFFVYILHHKNIVSDDVPFDSTPLDLVTIEVINSITQEDILNYLYYCKDNLKISSSTRSKNLSSIKQYFKYMYNHEKVIDDNPAIDIDSPKKAKTLPKYLTLDEALKLLDNIESNFYERDYCIITLFLNCGLRLSELISININDIKDNNTIRITGKGNKERTIYLNDACIKAIKQYIDKRFMIDEIKDKNALFISEHTKKRIGQRRVQQIVKENLKKIGLDDYSTHKLRHTAATLMYQNGTDVRTLQQLLGHSSLSTTQIYTHVIDSQIKDAVNTNPLSKYNKEKNKNK